MLNLILYSGGNHDDSVLEYAENNFGDQIALHAVLSEITADRSLKNRYDFAETHVFPACHLTGWGPAVAALLQLSLARDRENLLVDTDFAQTHGIGLSPFLEVARNHDFFSANGRFRLEEGQYSFSFPTWEMCYFAPSLWSDDECRNYLRYLKPVQDDYGRFYAVQYFFEHFRKNFNFGCLMDDRPALAFDPMAEPGVEIEPLLQKRRGTLEVE